ncbi:MAG: transposase [Prevotella sp.]|nr:transposase [Prevotella sp.]
MTILLLFHFGSYRNFKHYYLSYIKGVLINDFPTAVSYNRVFFQLMFFLNLQVFGRCTGITFVDSTVIPICHNLRRYANLRASPPMEKERWDGAMASNSIWHVMTEGRIIAFVLTGANVSDKEPEVFKTLAKRLYGKLFADKGYISQKLFDFSQEI